MPDDYDENPYRSFDIDDSAPVAEYDDGTIPVAPKVIGTLNIVFGALLGIGALCQGSYAVILAVSGPSFQAQMEAQMQADRERLESEIADLQAQMDAAPEAEIPELQRELARKEERVRMAASMPNPFQMFGLNDPRIVGTSAGVCIAAVLLNLFMFISGVGLLSYREWARKMGLWVAGLKLVNLLVVAVTTVVLIAPVMGAGMQDMMEQMAEAQGEELPAEAQQIGTGMTMAMTISMTIWTVLAAIYPIICLWQLMRRRVRLSCQPKPTAPAY